MDKNPGAAIPTELGRGAIDYHRILAAAVKVKIRAMYVTLEPPFTEIPALEAIKVDYEYSRVCTFKAERNALHGMSLRVAMVILAVGFSFGTWCARGQDQPAHAQKAPDAAAMFAGPDKVDPGAAERGQKIFAPTCGWLSFNSSAKREWVRLDLSNSVSG